MNKLTLIGFLTLALAVATQTKAADSARSEFYVEPSAVIAFPGHFNNAAGAALAIGSTFNGVHSVETDVISFKTEANSDDFTFTPVLATYKYRVALNERLSATAGASIGATFEKTEFFIPSGPGYYSGGSGHYYRISQTAFTSGVVAGVSYAMNERVSLSASAHLLHLQETDVTSSGNMLVIALGVKVRF